jgi:hypothetical protein
MSEQADELLNEVAHWQFERLTGGAWMADFHWHNARRLAAAIIGVGL